MSFGLDGKTAVIPERKKGGGGGGELNLSLSEKGSLALPPSFASIGEGGGGVILSCARERRKRGDPLSITEEMEAVP